jgi:hypothetical protein
MGCTFAGSTCSAWCAGRGLAPVERRAMRHAVTIINCLAENFLARWKTVRASDASRGRTSRLMNERLAYFAWANRFR